MTIVKENFPNVILGMKAMRALHLSINPAKECAQLQIGENCANSLHQSISQTSGNY